MGRESSSHKVILGQWGSLIQLIQLIQSQTSIAAVQLPIALQASADSTNTIIDHEAPYKHRNTWGTYLHGMLSTTRAAPRAARLLQVYCPRSSITLMLILSMIAQSPVFCNCFSTNLLLRLRTRPQDHFKGSHTSKARAPQESQEPCQQDNRRS